MDQPSSYALCRRTTAVTQVAETLHDGPAAQHVCQRRDVFPVLDRFMEGLGELLRYQNGEIGILTFLCAYECPFTVMSPLLFSVTTKPYGFMQNVRTRSSKDLEKYTSFDS